MDFTKIFTEASWGTLTLSAYLVLVGVQALTGFEFPRDEVVTAVLAVAAGVLTLLKK
jgi:hypothetical protein